MQKLLVYQSLWAMERRRPDGLEWSMPQKLEMIRDAGFDGAGVRFIDPDFAREVTSFLRDHDMIWQAQCYPTDVDDLKPVLELVARLGADHGNLQPNVRPQRIEACIPLLEGWRRARRTGRRRRASENPPRPYDPDLFSRCNYWIASRPAAYCRCLALPRVRDDSRNESGPETMNTSKNPTSSLNSSESVATLATHLPNIIVGDADTHPCKRTRSVLPMSPLRRFCSPIPGVGVKLSNISLPGRLFSPR